MARLEFSKIKERYNDYKKYLIWLEKNSFPKFCGYSWLIDQISLSIDHYKPRKHYPDLESEPDNLIPCTSNCNFWKSDYHPEAKNRDVYKKDNYEIFNYRKEDIAKYVCLEKDGQLKYRNQRCKERFYFNERIFKLNQPHLREVRREYIQQLESLKKIYDLLRKAKKKKDEEFLKACEVELEKMKRYCSRRYIFYKLLNIKIPRYLEKLLTNKTQARFI